MARRKKHLPIVLICAVIFIIGAAAVFLLWLGNLRQGAAEPKDSAENESSADIVWQGKEYIYNDHLSNYLFIGVDNREKEAAQTGAANAGQADALYLFSWDRVNGDLNVISIPRDTITIIEAFGPGGTSLGETEDHISLSYAYGDGGHQSCRLTVDAVSSLFYGLRIQGYCSINIEALPILTESVGGVTVTVPNDSLQAVDPRFQAGIQVTLNAEDTETFVRYRDTQVSQSALTRMERQQAYISGFGDAARQKAAEDPGFITELYSALEPYMVTSMGTDVFAQIMESAVTGASVSRWTVPGEGVQGEYYDEYLIDNEALYQKVIETFYKEV